MYEPSGSTLDNAFQGALMRSSRHDAEQIMRQLLARPAPAGSAEKFVVTALERIGADWESGRAALSQVYMSGRICEELMALIFPRTPEWNDGSARCAIVLLNDYHTLGKRIVLSALRASGFSIQDWGQMTQEQVAVKALESNVEVLLISTLMLASALKVENLKTELDAKGFKGKLLVGGAPFRLDKKLWKDVGADATADNAMDSIRVLSLLLGRQS
jgi:methanogenic corrinoid protein MtbC1